MSRPATTTYVAVVGDLVGSREVPDRAALQEKLKRVLRDPNLINLSACAAGPGITSGDEVQVLFEVSPAAPPGLSAIHFISVLTEELAPVEIVFGIGHGSLATPLGAPVHELDGPCFHRAREALDRAKREARWATTAGFGAFFGGVLDLLLRMTGEIRGSWTPRQREIIRLRRALPLQKDIARQLEVSPSVVSEALTAARHDTVLEAQEVMRMLIDRALLTAESAALDEVAPE